MNSFINPDQISSYDNEKDDMLKAEKNVSFLPQIIALSPKGNQVQSQSHELSYDEKEDEIQSNKQINTLQFGENGLAFSNTNKQENAKQNRSIGQVISKNEYPSCDSIEQKGQNDKKSDQHMKSKFNKENTYTSLKIDSNMNSQKEREDIFSKNTSFLQQTEYQSNIQNGSPTNQIQNINIYAKQTRQRSKDIFFFKAQHVKKFISKLKSKTMSYFLNLISRSVFDLLDDRSSDYNQFVHYRNSKQKVRIFICIIFKILLFFYTGQLQYIFIYLIQEKEKSLIHKCFIRAVDSVNKGFQSHYYVILPVIFFYLLMQLINLSFIYHIKENWIIFVWELFLSFYYLSQIILQPLRDSFPMQFKNQNTILIFHQQILPIIVFCIDSFFLFNTAIFKKGRLIKDRKSIFRTILKKRYMQFQSFYKTYILFHLNINKRYEVIVITLYYIGSYYEKYSVLQYAILLKSADFFGIFRKFCDLYDHNRQKMIYTQSLQIVLQIFILAHICACIFVTVAKAAKPAETWIDKLQIVIVNNNPSDTEIYSSALYWSIITMVTLGYGDIVPISQNEKLFVIFIAFVSCGLFGYSFNLISNKFVSILNVLNQFQQILGEVINESKKNKNKLKNDLEMLNNLIEERGLNNELKSKVRRYFEYLYKEKQKNIEVGQEMIGNLPPNLKDEVMNDLYSKLIKQQPLFSQNFTEQFIYDISLTIKEFKVGPELLIQKKHAVQDRLYIILKGEVRLYWEMLPQTNTTIETLTKGHLLGLQDFITQTPVEYFARSETVISLGYIQYSEFLDILRKHPKDQETYYKLKDKLNIYRQGAACRIFCRFCKKSVHPAEECPLITYQPNLNKVMYQSKKLELVTQDRSKQIIRNQKMKQNSRYMLNIVIDNANKAANDLFNENQIEENKKYNKLNQNSLKIEQLLTNEGESNLVAFKLLTQENKSDDQQYQHRLKKQSYQQNVLLRNTSELVQLSIKDKKESQITSDIHNKILQIPSNLQTHNRNKSQTCLQPDELEEKNKDPLKKYYSSIDNGFNQVSQNEKQNSQQVPSTIFQKTMQYPLLSLEEIQEMVQNPGEQEGSLYYSYKSKDTGNQYEKQDMVVNNNNYFNNVSHNNNSDHEQNGRVPTLNFLEQNNFTNNNLQLMKKNSTRQDDNSQRMYEKQGTNDKVYPEDINLMHKNLEKRRTMAIEEQEQLLRLQKKQFANIMNLAEKYSTNVSHADTPISMAKYQQGRRRTSQNQTNTFGNNVNLQNLPNSPSNSQQNIQQMYEVDDEFELPFIQLPTFDKPFNYTFYFPYNNPRQILRDIEDKRLQFLERKRKAKVQKKVQIPDKPKSSLQQQNTQFMQSDRKLL